MPDAVACACSCRRDACVVRECRSKAAVDVCLCAPVRCDARLWPQLPSLLVRVGAEQLCVRVRSHDPAAVLSAPPHEHTAIFSPSVIARSSSPTAIARSNSPAATAPQHHCLRSRSCLVNVTNSSISLALNTGAPPVCFFIAMYLFSHTACIPVSLHRRRSNSPSLGASIRPSDMKAHRAWKAQTSAACVAHQRAMTATTTSPKDSRNTSTGRSGWRPCRRDPSEETEWRPCTCTDRLSVTLRLILSLRKKESLKVAPTSMALFFWP